MTKTAKISAITLTTVIVLGGLGYFGLNQLARTIYNQRTCEWANIDNIEMHAQVDIPEIVAYYCRYEEETNTKKARFDIDKVNVDMDRYIEFNNFNKLKTSIDISFEELLQIESNPTDLVNSSDLYYTKGFYDGETWQTLLDSSTGKLWVTVKYKN